MPKSFRMERSVEIEAPTETVFTYVNDLLLWQQWSPWEGLDKDLQRTYSEKTEGVGARYRWDGNRKVGKGSMEIVESRQAEVVVLELRFIRPFKAENLATFTLESIGSITRVTWALTGDQGLVARLIGIVFSMDKMVGPDFERGLNQLKATVERH